MNELVVMKWCANIWAGEVLTALIPVRETESAWTLIPEASDEKWGGSSPARGFKTIFHRDYPMLFDTEIEALTALLEHCDAQCCVAAKTFDGWKKKHTDVAAKINLTTAK